MGRSASVDTFAKLDRPQLYLRQRPIYLRQRPKKLTTVWHNLAHGTRMSWNIGELRVISTALSC
jgi:hypothetical protein